MKKIILFDTSIATLNLGDEIIMDSIQREFIKILNKNYYIKMPVHTPLFHKYQTILSKKVDQFKNVDYKFICGTNLLYKNMLRPLPVWNVNIFNTSLWKGSILVGVGSGENSKNITKYTRYLYSKVLSKDYYHSVRDEKTKEMLISLGYKAINTGCPTIWSLTQNHCSEIPAKKANDVVFTLTSYKHLRDIDNDKKIINILRRNYKNIYFWPQNFNDLNYLYEIDSGHNIIIIPPNLKSYKHILENNNIDYVGTRLHGGIFALQEKKRTIIIAIDHRARNMKESYSLPCIDRDMIESELELMINSEFSTKISGVDQDKILFWKSQFSFD